MVAEVLQLFGSVRNNGVAREPLGPAWSFVYIYGVPPYITSASVHILCTQYTGFGPLHFTPYSAVIALIILTGSLVTVNSMCMWH